MEYTINQPGRIPEAVNLSSFLLEQFSPLTITHWRQEKKHKQQYLLYLFEWHVKQKLLDQ